MRRRVLPGSGPILGSSGAYLGLIVLPLAGLVAKAATPDRGRQDALCARGGRAQLGAAAA